MTPYCGNFPFNTSLTTYAWCWPLPMPALVSTILLTWLTTLWRCVHTCCHCYTGATCGQGGGRPPFRGSAATRHSAVSHDRHPDPPISPAHPYPSSLSQPLSLTSVGINNASELLPPNAINPEDTRKTTRPDVSGDKRPWPFTKSPFAHH